MEESYTVPVAPAGYHYRGQSPIRDNLTGKITSLARYCHNETKLDRKDIYCDLWVSSKDQKLKCLLCQEDIAGYYSPKTGNLDFSNFFVHIGNKHYNELTPTHQKVKFDALEAKKPGAGGLKQVTLTADAFVAKASSPGSKGPGGSLVANSKKRVAAIFATLCSEKGTFPISYVEDPFLRTAIRAFVKGFCGSSQQSDIHFPSRQTVRRYILAKIEADDELQCEKLRELLTDKGRQFVSVTNDSTTSIARNPYTCLTTSLIQRSPLLWKIVEMPLDCNYNPGAHTAQSAFRHIVGRLHACLPWTKDERIEECISIATFDGGSNTPASGLRNAGVSTLICACHRLSTFLEHMDKECDEWKQCRESVEVCMSAVKRSTKNLEVLETHTKTRPVFGASTRWTYDIRMLRRGKALLPFFLKMDVSLMYFKNAGKKKEWEDALTSWSRDGQYYMNYLLPFYERIEYWVQKLESGREVTISLLLHHMVDDLRCLVTDFFPKRVKVDHDRRLDPAAVNIPSLPSDIYDGLCTIFDTASTEIDRVFLPYEGSLLLNVAECLHSTSCIPYTSMIGSNSVVGLMLPRIQN